MVIRIQLFSIQFSHEHLKMHVKNLLYELLKW